MGTGGEFQGNKSDDAEELGVPNGKAPNVETASTKGPKVEGDETETG
jgi:hypothetical protein